MNNDVGVDMFLINEAVNVFNVTVSLLSHFPLFHMGSGQCKLIHFCDKVSYILFTQTLNA